jgi:hypothetical protein
MHRYSVAELDTDKSHPGTYRIGDFLITRTRSRWRVSARDAAIDKKFSTLGGAIAWCRQQLESMPTSGIKPRHP